MIDEAMYGCTGHADSGGGGRFRNIHLCFYPRSYV